VLVAAGEARLLFTLQLKEAICRISEFLVARGTNVGTEVRTPPRGGPR